MTYNFLSLSTAALLSLTAMTQASASLQDTENLFVERKETKHQEPSMLSTSDTPSINLTVDNLGGFYRLGLGDPVPVAAEHGIGIGDLYDVLWGSISSYLPSKDYLSLATTSKSFKTHLFSKASLDTSQITIPLNATTQDNPHILNLLTNLLRPHSCLNRS